MNDGKTPLVQKLILGVLTLILICLVVLIAQNRQKPAVPVSDVNTTAEPPPEEVAVAPTESKVEPPRSPPPRAGSQPVRGQPAVAREEPAAPPVVPPVAAQPVPPQPYVTLVSPSRPKPLDIVVHPQTPVLKTEICGRVRLEGQPPPEVPIRLDASCNRLNDGQPATTRHYVIGPEGGLANVLVYIKSGLSSHYTAPPMNSATVTVRRCFYEPYVTGLQAGQTLTVLNADKILHNVHLTSKMNRELNFALAVAGQKRQLTLDQPETFVRIKCDVHPWEFAYVGVVPHPFFGVSDTNGVFCLPAGLPEGRYVLAAVHTKAGETLREIIVQQDDVGPIDIAFTVPRR
jgi:plastocyanin